MDDEVVEPLWDALKWAQSGNDPRTHTSFRRPEYQAHLDRIESAVSAHPDLRALDGKFIRSGSASARVSTHLVAGALLRRAYECDSADIALRDVLAFVRSPRLDVLTVVTLAGIKLDRTLTLSKHLSLCPPSALPQSENFARLFPHEFNKREHLIFLPWTTFASAALVRSWSIENAIVDATLDNLSEPLDPTEEELEIDRAICCTVLCTTEGVQRMHRYHENLHPGHLWPGSGWSEHPAVATYRDPAPVNETDLCDLFSLTKQFADWQEFSRLVKRLNAARCKLDLVDAHIDLGIVAECALTKGDKQESEISQRLRTRSAWLLGRSPDERRAIAKATSDLYSRRSSAAHRGVVSSHKRDHYEADDRLCRDLLIEILRRGAFPQSSDWSGIVYG